ncbi:MAG: Na+/H+ antiporter subunit C [Chloroflexaceae bacterium]|nr:Na+/H+ antiporter subunit C [Chloroflexaceae bacterium]
MESLLAFVVGGLYAGGIYLMLRRSMIKLIFGLVLLGHASNLLIFTVGRLTSDQPPLVPDGAETLTEPFADPLPQALILTAIVIGFGMQAFALVLVKRMFLTARTDDVHAITTTDTF